MRMIFRGLTGIILKKLNKINRNNEYYRKHEKL